MIFRAAAEIHFETQRRVIRTAGVLPARKQQNDCGAPKCQPPDWRNSGNSRISEGVAKVLSFA
jgi:hypothetical protein